MINSKQLETLNTEIYNDYYSSGWEDGWELKDKKLNFGNLFKITEITNIPLDNCSILDVGCGTGDILYFLPDSVKYTGIDIYKPALRIAKSKYPKANFKYGNILNIKLGKYDYVFCSGALSVNIGNNYDFLEKVVKKMFKVCKYGIAFNILTDEQGKNNEDEYLFLYNIKKVKKICKEIGQIKTTYTPMDRNNDQHTVYMWK